MRDLFKTVLSRRIINDNNFEGHTVSVTVDTADAPEKVIAGVPIDADDRHFHSVVTKSHPHLDYLETGRPDSAGVNMLWRPSVGSWVGTLTVDGRIAEASPQPSNARRQRGPDPRGAPGG
jgi:hypothetical protein